MNQTKFKMDDSPESETQRKSSLMQRTNTILERIDAEGKEITHNDEEDSGMSYEDIDNSMSNPLCSIDNSKTKNLDSLFMKSKGNLLPPELSRLVLDANTMGKSEDKRNDTEVTNKPKVDETQARLLLEKAESIQSSDSGSDSDTNTSIHDEDIMSVSMMDNLRDSDYEQTANRPDSLSLPRPLQYYERQHRKLVRSESKSSSCSNYSQSSTEALIEAATSTPLHVQGKITRQGDSIEFVAEDLTEKIRMSSPLTKQELWMMSRTSSNRSISSVSSSTSGLSASSASGWSALSATSGMSRSPSVVTQSPDDIPPIDPRAILDLEVAARFVAASLDKMMFNLHLNLRKMSSLSASCVDAYKDGIDKTCDSVDASIKSMYALMAKCEELSTSITPVYQLADQIKEINRLLDLFELQLAKDEKPALQKSPVSSN